MPFYPDDAPVPTELRTDEFLLRPLRATDVELDYDAVVASRELLRTRFGGDWPRDDFTLAENLADLQRHEEDFRNRAGFTYTVMNPTETECLGCAYLYPLAGALRRMGVGADAVAQVGESEAAAVFWARGDRVGDGLDKRLLAALLPWLRREFAFPRIAFGAFETDERLLTILREVGLTHVASHPTRNANHLLFE